MDTTTKITFANFEGTLNEFAALGRIDKYNDPTEEAREGLTIEEAEDIAREDCGLLYVEFTGNIAQTIAARYGNDGQNWLDGAAIDIDDACETAGGQRAWGNDEERYDFSDGSALVLTGGGWDLAIEGSSPACHCWASADGGRHDSECVDSVTLCDASADEITEDDLGYEDDLPCPEAEEIAAGVERDRLDDERAQREWESYNPINA